MGRSRIVRPLRGDGRQRPPERPGWQEPPERPAMVVRCRTRRILAVMRDGTVWQRGELEPLRRSGSMAAPLLAWCPTHKYGHDLDRAKLAELASAATPGRAIAIDVSVVAAIIKRES